MRYTITKKLLDLLAASTSPYVWSGGNAYSAGWTSVVSVYSGSSAVDGRVNLHKTAEKSDSARPAVYCGTKGLKWTDRVYRGSINPVGTQFRELTAYLIVVARATTLTSAENQAEQLARNVKSTLMQNRAGGSLPYISLCVENMRETESGTGSGSPDISESRIVIEVKIIYSDTPSSNA